MNSMLKPIASGLLLLNRRKTIVLLILMWTGVWSGVYSYWLKDLVNEILLRLPINTFSPLSLSLLNFEAEYLMMKTSMAVPTVGVILTLFAIRYLITPVIQAGLYHVLINPTDRAVADFKEGVRQWAGPFYVILAVKWAILVLPLLILVVKWMTAWKEAYYIQTFLDKVMTSVIAYIVYFIFISFWFMWVQIAVVNHPSRTIPQQLCHGLWFLLKKSFPIIILVGVLLFGFTVIGIVIEGVAALSAGLLLVLLHQLSILWRSFTKIWFISSSIDFYKTNQQKS